MIAGYPVVDVRCALVFGKYHPVDSSEAAFKTAGALGFKAAFSAANPVLLEPVMHVEVTVPSEFAGDIMGDLNTRRAHIHGMTPDGPNTVIEASVPQIGDAAVRDRLAVDDAGTGDVHDAGLPL